MSNAVVDSLFLATMVTMVTMLIMPMLHDASVVPKKKWNTYVY